MISVLGLWVHLNIFGTHILNIFSILPTGHIVIAFRQTFKMCLFVCGLVSLESHGWAHSKCTQHVPTGHIGVTWQGIFKMYSTFNHWAHWSHMLTALSMFSLCTQWVFGPLSPVTTQRTQRPIPKRVHPYPTGTHDPGHSDLGHLGHTGQGPFGTMVNHAPSLFIYKRIPST